MSVPLSALIEKMRHPQFYPHPVEEQIEVFQTHISYVVLTGKYAYKIKKAVSFERIDFVQLQSRKHYCEEELRLNREYSPQLYLEVLPITVEDNEEYALNGLGKVVEYTLKMRQFPQSALFSQRLENQKIEENHIKMLGQTIAKVHAKAKPEHELSWFGSAEAVSHISEGNFKDSLPFVGIYQSQENFEEICQFTRNFIQNHLPLFQQRSATGKIKDGHGDLHLKNICWLQEVPILFDRIEFSEEYRKIDVLYDLAYLMVDLDAHHKPDFANLLLNSYLERTGEFLGVVLLPLFLSMRAYIRAWFYSDMTTQAQLTKEKQNQFTKMAKDYYRRSRTYFEKNCPRLWMVCGFSGAGKSEVARYLAQPTHAIHLRSDAIRKHLGNIALDQKGEPWLYTKEMTKLTYSTMKEIALTLLKAGFEVILDARYDQYARRKEIIEMIQTENVPFHLLYCHASPEVLYQRVADRKGDISDATIVLIDQQMATTEDLRDIELPYVQRINTELSWQSQMEDLLENWNFADFRQDQSLEG